MENYSQYLWNMIFANPDPIGRWVIKMIFGLFVVAVADVIFSLYRLIRERGLIRRVKGELETAAASPKTEDELQNASLIPTTEDKLLEYFNIPGKGLLGRRVSRVMRLRKAGLGQREVLQQITGEKIEGYGALARYIGATLTLLGLLGTVFGLSFALVKIQGALSDVQGIEGLSKLTEALGGTLQGMKTAFGCTLAGIFAAVVTSYLNHHVRRAQSRAAADLEELVICDLLPALESVDPNADSAAKAFANTLSSSAKTLEQVQTTISTAAEKYQGGSQELQRVVEALQVAVQTSSNSMSTVTGNQQAFTETMAETRNAVNSLTTIMAKQAEDLHAYTASCTKVLEERLNAMEQTTKTNLSLQESLHTLAQSFQPAIVEYHKQFREFLNLAQDEFKNSLKSLLTDVNQHYKEGVAAHVSNSQKAFENTLTTHVSNLRGIIEQNNRELTQLFEKQSAALGAFGDMVLDASSRMGTLYNRMSDDDNGRGRVASPEGGVS